VIISKFTKKKDMFTWMVAKKSGEKIWGLKIHGGAIRVPLCWKYPRCWKCPRYWKCPRCWMEGPMAARLMQVGIGTHRIGWWCQAYKRCYGHSADRCRWGIAWIAWVRIWCTWIAWVRVWCTWIAWVRVWCTSLPYRTSRARTALCSGIKCKRCRVAHSLAVRRHRLVPLVGGIRLPDGRPDGHIT